MLIIPGVLISIVTFPGVIVHELAHQLCCRFMGVPVLEVKYFQPRNPSGYVIHDVTDRPLANFIISVGPFFFNTVAGAAVIFPAALGYQSFGLSHIGLNLALELFTGWLGISILAHAFPSRGDASAMVSCIMKNKQVNILVKILVAPVIGLIYLGSIGSVVWLDFIYAIGVGVLLPRFILTLL